MKKRIAWIVMLFAVAVLLSGCNLIGHDEALDGAQLVAKVNDTEITKAQWEAAREYMAAYYQQYYQQYLGINMPMTDEDIVAYGEPALEQLIENVVLQDKMAELGFDQLTEEETADVTSYADSMMSFYKMLLRYQNYADVETVEEEAERLAAATPSEAAEAVATITNDELDAMLESDLAAIGYTYDYFVESESATKAQQKLRDSVTADVTVTEEQVKAEFDSRVEAQQKSYDAAPANYATAENNGTSIYYVPAGYRGVKNLLVQISDEDKKQIDALNDSIKNAQTALDDAAKQLEEMKAEDVAVLDEQAKAAYDEQVAALEKTVTESEATIAEAQPKVEALTEEAFAKILPIAEEALAKAQAGEDFDKLVEDYGKDAGMQSEPNKSRGYLVCEGLKLYEQNFQDAAMALTDVGAVSDLVKTGYGYHILQYATDVKDGVVEYTDEIKSAIESDLLATAQDAAYTAAVTQWVAEAKVTTYPKIMK